MSRYLLGPEGTSSMTVGGAMIGSILPCRVSNPFQMLCSQISKSVFENFQELKRFKMKLSGVTGDPR